MDEFISMVKDFTEGLYACEAAVEVFENVHSEEAFFSAIATVIDHWCESNDVDIEESNECLKDIIEARRERFLSME